MRIIYLLVFLFCGFIFNTNCAYTLELDHSDIYITPEADTDFFSGYVGGDAFESYDWAIGNGVPYGPITKDMVFSTYEDSLFQERMRITIFGNVGIGTASPAGKLDVSDTEILAAEATECSAGYELTNDADGDGSPGEGDTCTRKGLIVKDGNVGIGTADPDARLHVNGMAKVDGIKFPDGTKKLQQT